MKKLIGTLLTLAIVISAIPLMSIASPEKQDPEQDILHVEFSEYSLDASFSDIAIEDGQLNVSIDVQNNNKWSFSTNPPLMYAQTADGSRYDAQTFDPMLSGNSNGEFVLVNITYHIPYDSNELPDKVLMETAKGDYRIIWTNSGEEEAQTEAGQDNAEENPQEAVDNTQPAGFDIGHMEGNDYLNSAMGIRFSASGSGFSGMEQHVAEEGLLEANDIPWDDTEALTAKLDSGEPILCFLFSDASMHVMPAINSIRIIAWKPAPDSSGQDPVSAVLNNTKDDIAQQAAEQQINLVSADIIDKEFAGSTWKEMNVDLEQNGIHKRTYYLATAAGDYVYTIMFSTADERDLADYLEHFYPFDGSTAPVGTAAEDADAPVEEDADLPAEENTDMSEIEELADLFGLEEEDYDEFSEITNLEEYDEELVAMLYLEAYMEKYHSGEMNMDEIADRLTPAESEEILLILYDQVLTDTYEAFKAGGTVVQGSGSDLAAGLQYTLNQFNFSLSVDGNAGPATFEALDTLFTAFNTQPVQLVDEKIYSEILFMLFYYYNFG